MLKRMQPRSIRSRRLSAHQGEIHLTVSAVRYHNGRRARKGVASTFLADRADDGRVPVFVQKSAHFRPPVNGDVPIVMVGPGTGVAPFRGFLRAAGARRARRNWLFFGEQHAQTDFYYGDELGAMHDSGFLTRLDLAFSRTRPTRSTCRTGCASRRRAVRVAGGRRALLRVRRCRADGEGCRHGAEGGGRRARRMSDEAANDYVARLSKARRYMRDVY